MADVSDDELNKAFAMFDDNGDGTITIEEMLGLVSKIGGNLSEGEAVGLIRQADSDNNGVIDKEEFRTLWAAVRSSGEGEDELRKEFAECDVDSTGLIMKEDMWRIVGKSSCCTRTLLARSESQKVCSDLQEDEDGRVSYTEFLIVWKLRALGGL